MVKIIVVDASEGLTRELPTCRLGGVAFFFYISFSFTLIGGIYII